MSGNGRTNAIKMMYDDQSGESAYSGAQFDKLYGKAQQLQQRLTIRAKEFGISGENVMATPKPMLVRVLDDEKLNMFDFAVKANNSQNMVMSASEQAKVDAGLMRDFVDNFSSMNLDSAANVPFLKKFLERVCSPSELNDMFDSNQQHLSANGKTRILNALFAAAYGDDPEILSMLSEVGDPVISKLINALKEAAADTVKLAGDVKNGLCYNVPIAKAIGEAVRKIRDIKNDPKLQNVIRTYGVADAYFRQGLISDDGMSPAGRLFLAVLGGDLSNNVKSMSDFIIDCNNVVRKSGNPRQPMLDGTYAPAPATEDVVAAALRNNGYNQQTIDSWKKGPVTADNANNNTNYSVRSDGITENQYHQERWNEEISRNNPDMKKVHEESDLAGGKSMPTNRATFANDDIDFDEVMRTLDDEGTAITREELEEKVKEIRKKIDPESGITIEVRNNPREDFGKKAPKGGEALNIDGRVILYADNLTQENWMRKLVHEVLGHSTAKMLLGGRNFRYAIEGVLQLARNNPKVREVFHDILVRYQNMYLDETSSTRREMLLEELLADCFGHLSDDRNYFGRTSLFDRIKSWVRGKLRNWGMNVRVSDLELRDLFRRSMEVVTPEGSWKSEPYKVAGKKTGTRWSAGENDNALGEFEEAMSRIDQPRKPEPSKPRQLTRAEESFNRVESRFEDGEWDYSPIGEKIATNRIPSGRKSTKENYKEILEECYNLAKNNVGLLKKICEEAQNRIGVEYIHLRKEHSANEEDIDPRDVGYAVKGHKRATEKAINDYKGDATRVVDLIGGTVVIKDETDYVETIDTIKEIIRQKGGNLLRTKVFAPDLEGYKDIKLLIRFPNGGVGEIILLDKFMAEAKDKRGGHVAYDVARLLDKKEYDNNKEALLTKVLFTELSYAVYNHNGFDSSEFERLKEIASSSLTRLCGNDSITSSEDIGVLKSSLEKFHLLKPYSENSKATRALSDIKNDITDTSNLGDSPVSPSTSSITENEKNRHSQTEEDEMAQILDYLNNLGSQLNVAEDVLRKARKTGDEKQIKEAEAALARTKAARKGSEIMASEMDQLYSDLVRAAEGGDEDARARAERMADRQLESRGYSIDETEGNKAVMSFEQKQIKQRGITYDDNGRLIPLSSRGDNTKRDTRWSINSNNDSDQSEGDFDSEAESPEDIYNKYVHAVKQLGDSDELGNILQTAKENGTLGKAPNGKKSNLEPAQWLMVRTKQFKNWFGDWEYVAKAYPMNRAQGRNEVKAYIDSLKGKTLVSLEENIEAKLSKDGRSKIISDAALNKSLRNGFTISNHFTAVANLEELFKNSIRTNIRKDDGNNDSLITIEHFSAPIVFQKEPSLVTFTVKVTRDYGRKIYSIELMELKK